MKKLLLTFSLIALTSTINAQWVAQATGFSAPSRGLSQIKVIDANTVWALAYDGTNADNNVQEFTRTTNGGTLWTPGTIELGDPDLQINNISAVSATTAWVSAIVNLGNDNPTDGVGTIVKTTDGGLTWTPQFFQGFQTAGSSFLNGVHFFNANVGIAYGDPVAGEFEIWRTTNGGDTWTQVAASALPNPVNGEYGYNSAPTAVGNSLWFTTNKGNLYRTTDAGLNWTKYSAPLNNFGGALPANSGTIYFSTESNGYLLKISGTTASPVYSYYTTTNGAQSWSAETGFTGTRRILNYIPGTNSIVATSQVAPVGTSISTNNGATWTDLESSGITQRGASAFLNISTGWCAGFSGANAGIFKLSGPLGVDNASIAKFKVYPNPTTSVVTISATDVDSYNLSVNDLSGKTVMTKSLNGMENTVDISGLSTGTYFFELKSNNKKEVVKIIKN